MKDTASVINSLIIHKKRKMHVQPEEKSNFRKKKIIINHFKCKNRMRTCMDLSCLVTTVQAGGGDVMVWRMLSWHTLGPLVPTGHCLKAMAYLNIVSDHVHPLMATMYPSSDGYFQQDNAPCHKA